eukprot:CAMPEP_0114138500 /NCGR_PEP_ID=MMETSP0043_2-20121206/16354_1 /TAXON_ID=464988 /ORGANISM="Hemiselmis andersenii, Strain CCMP644" /LENGTH=213 /DNA_ID=CAMNT_0001232471 /DNA_START=125 /DNA_END=766 /DNA_ORIENTATION=+
MSSKEEQSMWEGMWAAGLKPGDRFDKSKSSQSFLDVLASWQDTAKAKKVRALIPGCGRGYDVVEAARFNFDALGLDISPTAVQAAQAYRDSQGELGGRAEFSTTDFFTLPEPGAFDLVFDYTFLCAIDPSTRSAWAETHKRLIKPGGELVTLIYPIRPKDDNGPPYAMDTELVRGLLEPQGFVCESMVPVPHAKSHPGREGMEVLARWRAPMQ